MKRSLALSLLLCALPAPAFAIGRMRTSDTHLELESLSVRVLVEDSHTRTEVDHVFRNQSEQPAEAVFDFPLAPRATFSGLSIWVNGEEIQGEVVEQQRARSIYSSITGIEVDELKKPTVRARSNKQRVIPRPKDPGLLQMHGRLLRLRVAPVPAHGVHRVRVRYVEANHIENGLGRYVFPMAFDGRRAAEAKTFQCQVRIMSQRRIDRSWTPSHQREASIHTERPGHIYELSFKEKNVKLSQDFECRYQFAHSAGPEVQAHCSEQSAQITVTPYFQGTSSRRGRDIIFVVDSSKSMWRHLYELRKAFDGFHSFLREQDRFNIISFHLGATVFHPKMQTLKTFRRADITHYFAQQKYQLQADPNVALCALKKIWKNSGQPGRRVELVFITDAEFSDQPALLRAMAAAAEERQYRCFALELGPSLYPQRPLTQFSEKTGGACYAASAHKAYGRAQDLLQSLYSPFLTDVKLTLKGVKLKDVYPKRLPSTLRSGFPFHFYGRMDKVGEGQLQLSGKTSEGRLRKWTLPLSLQPDDKLDIDRLHGQSMANALLDQLTTKGLNRRQAANLERQLLKVSLDAQILTPATCLIVLENESLFQQHQVDRHNKDKIRAEKAAEERRRQRMNQNFDSALSERESLAMAPASSSNIWRGPRFSRGGGAGDPMFIVMAFFAALSVYWKTR